MKVIYSILRLSDWPWGMAIWFALREGSIDNAPERPEYLGTAPVPIVQ